MQAEPDLHKYPVADHSTLCCREIHPLDTRSAGQSLNVLVNLLFTFVIGQSFLAMLCGMKFGVFLFFAGAHSRVLPHGFAMDPLRLL